MSLSKSKKIVTLMVAAIMLLASQENAIADQELGNAFVNSGDRTIEGLSGGSIDSQGCGYIADIPNYEMNLADRVDYMRFTVEAAAGQPTLLVVGPNSGDSFCVLGDEISGLKPEISGVWEPGNYQIYVGNRTNEQHEFILDISTDN